MRKTRSQPLRALRSLIAGAAVAVTCAVLAGTPAAAGDTAWPSEVTARYRMSFNGFDVGTYDFTSRYDGKSYAATGKTQISALFGAFKWTGNFAGTGLIGNGTPRPASYEMVYKTKSKLTSVKLGFAGDTVSSIALVPNKPPKPDTIKVKSEDLRNVFDPMAATLALSSAHASDACNRTIPIFDGKARFDLQLSLKGREAIKDKKPTGQPAELIVCRVKYVPIAGHKPKDFVNPWIDYDHIEIALRAIPSAGIYVPYRITVPSTIGAAVMDADAINIVARDNVQIALRQ
jgi:hypothetical protein